MTFEDCTLEVCYSTDPKYEPKFFFEGVNTYLECRSHVIYFRKYPTEIILEKRQCNQPRTEAHERVETTKWAYFGCVGACPLNQGILYRDVYGRLVVTKRR